MLYQVVSSALNKTTDSITSLAFHRCRPFLTIYMCLSTCWGTSRILSWRASTGLAATYTILEIKTCV